MIPGQFYCYRCYRNSESRLYPYDKTDIGLDISFLSTSGSKSYSFEEHVEKLHCVQWEYAFWCSACKKPIGVNSWGMHLYRECRCYEGICKFASSSDDSKEFGGSDLEKGTFRCLLCGEKREKETVFPVVLKYEHLRDKHPGCLPKRNFYCKRCKGTVSEADWEEHAKTKHIDVFHGEKFYCLICKEEWEKRYEDHMREYHAGQCPFCEEAFPEGSRSQHMLEKHGFPCPICGKQVDALLGVHLNRAHPYFEGYCKCQKYREDDNGKYYYEPCEWPSFRVFGLTYAKHLLGNTHGVGKNGENGEFCFECCHFKDFMGSRKEVISHVTSKHQVRFFECLECRELIFELTEEQHRQIKHDKTHWWCEDCAAAVSYESKDEKERSASINKHLLTMHEKIYGECTFCSQIVQRKAFDAHMESRHRGSYFRCPACHKYTTSNSDVEVQQHMSQHPECNYCEICKTWLSLPPFKHHEEKHQELFFCRLCLGSFEDRAEHIEDIHPNAESCACGERLLSYEVGENWHTAKHSIHCPLCNGAKPLNHMVTEHKCKEGVCKPIVSTKELTWKWRCDPSCKTHDRPCPLEQIRGCQFTGSAEQLNEHMRAEHKCEETCGFNESKDFVHDVSCRNEPAYCSLCEGNVDNREPHWMKVHGCREGCLIAIGKGKWHQVDCKEWTLPRCPTCSAIDVDRKHIFEHLPTCGEKGCYLMQDCEGYVSIQHQGHSDKSEEFSAQCCEDDIEIEYNSEEDIPEEEGQGEQ